MTILNNENKKILVATGMGFTLGSERQLKHFFHGKLFSGTQIFFNPRAKKNPTLFFVPPSQQKQTIFTHQQKQTFPSFEQNSFDNTNPSQSRPTLPNQSPFNHPAPPFPFPSLPMQTYNTTQHTEKTSIPFPVKLNGKWSW